MKLLTLIRHAKSDHDNDLSDFDRPLSERGEKDAHLMGEYLAKNLTKPDLIISSSAERAARTAEIIAETIGYPLDDIDYVDELYLCSVPEYVEVLIEQNVKIKHIFLVSHNPGTTGFANLLTNADIEDVPTCGVVQIELDFHKWDDIEAESGRLLKFITPKKI